MNHCNKCGQDYWEWCGCPLVPGSSSPASCSAEVRQLLEDIHAQLECPARNTTMTSLRRDGSVIISQDIRQRLSDWLKSNPQNNVLNNQ